MVIDYLKLNVLWLIQIKFNQDDKSPDTFFGSRIHHSQILEKMLREFIQETKTPGYLSKTT